MNKKVSKILAIVLIMSLVFSTGSVAFADAKQEIARVKVEQKKPVNDLKIPTLHKKGGSIKGEIKPAAQTGAVLFKTISLYTTLIKTDPAIDFREISYDQTAPGVFAQPITVSGKGVVDFCIVNPADKAGNIAQMKFGIYADSDLNTPISEGTAPKEDKLYYVLADIPAAGTYYLGIKPASGTVTQQQFAYGVAYFYKGANNRVLKNKKGLVVGQMNGQSLDFKFKAKKTGELYMGSAFALGTLTLLSKSKKRLSDKVYIADNYPGVSFGVQKGKTYFIRMNTPYSNDEGIYILQANNAKVAGKGGSTKAKAKPLVKKKIKKGTIIAGSKKAHWYKFKVPTNKKVVVDMKGATNKQIKVNIYLKKKGKPSRTFNYTCTRTKFGGFSLTGFGGYNCHVKVVRGDKYSSGWFSFKRRK